MPEHPRSEKTLKIKCREVINLPLSIFVSENNFRFETETALSQMVPAWLWSSMFFLTLFMLGLNSVIAGLEGANTGLMDILEARIRRLESFELRMAN